VGEKLKNLLKRNNMATIKKTVKKSSGIKKAQKGVKETAFQSYVKKYPGSGSDTIARFDPRNKWSNTGFGGQGSKQKEDLKSAFTKTYGKKDVTGVDQEDEATYRVKQKRKGGVVKKKMQAGGVAGKSRKAPMVDPKGAYTKVQQRTLGNMKKGGNVISKKK